MEIVNYIEAGTFSTGISTRRPSTVAQCVSILEGVSILILQNEQVLVKHNDQQQGSCPLTKCVLTYILCSYSPTHQGGVNPGNFFYKIYYLWCEIKVNIRSPPNPSNSDNIQLVENLVAVCPSIY